jgi:hypothetical protein
MLICFFILFFYVAMWVNEFLHFRMKQVLYKLMMQIIETGAPGTRLQLQLGTFWIQVGPKH